MKNTLFLILVTSLILLSCERDDICAAGTPTTPLLLVDFFDVADINTQKSVIRLSAYSEALSLNDAMELVPPTAASNASIVFNANTDNLQLPLLVGVEGETTTTRYVLERDTNLRLDTDDTTNSNIDILEISYVSEFVYVSRACGFKSVFTELNARVIDDGDTWIRSLSFPNSDDIINITVENENDTHVRLFH